MRASSIFTYSSNALFVVSRPFTEITATSPGRDFQGVVAKLTPQKKSAATRKDDLQNFFIFLSEKRGAKN
jgi:hypothetical protein